MIVKSIGFGAQFRHELQRVRCAVQRLDGVPVCFGCVGCLARLDPAIQHNEVEFGHNATPGAWPLAYASPFAKCVRWNSQTPKAKYTIDKAISAVSS
jgi:hypothetical protein